MLDVFHDKIYKPANDLIINKKDTEIRILAKTILAKQYNEMMPALMVFDKYWPTMTNESKEAVWQYLLVLCKLCEKVKEGN